MTAGQVIIGAAFIGLIPAFIARSKGYSFLAWWLYGAALFIVAIVHVLILQPNPGTVRKCRIASAPFQLPRRCAPMARATYPPSSLA
jgi:disulfide bond formation protein DsbB